MAQTLSNLFSSKVTCQLDTYNYTTINAGNHVVAATVSELPPSGLIIEIKQNGSSKALTSTPAAQQSSVDLRIVLNCAASDTLSIILSSPNAGDASPNVIKAILNIHQGSS